ncbi:MOXD1-like protein 2 [Trichoplax sp. H2]|nr:MOXD1-like protein 2 [Trichoplax sp. H2]|eukprot:RDD42887.1 MOXD1-like protein 2 [Trichoplax sp. H2]
MAKLAFISVISVSILLLCLIKHSATSSCNGKLTADCNKMTRVCNQELSWRATKKEIEFTITAKTDKWLGVGVSKDQLMPFTDTYVGWTARGKTYLSDRYIGQYRTAPTLDSNQNVFNVNGSYANGYSSLSFKRPITTGDSNDISVNGCRYFFLAIGGSFNEATKQIDRHVSTPIATPQAICIDPSKC